MAVGVAVLVGVNVKVEVAVWVGVAEGVIVFVGVAVLVGVAVRVRGGVAVRNTPPRFCASAKAYASAASRRMKTRINMFFGISSTAFLARETMLGRHELASYPYYTPIHDGMQPGFARCRSLLGV